MKIDFSKLIRTVSILVLALVIFCSSFSSGENVNLSYDRLLKSLICSQIALYPTNSNENAFIINSNNKDILSLTSEFVVSKTLPFCTISTISNSTTKRDDASQKPDKPNDVEVKVPSISSKEDDEIDYYKGDYHKGKPTVLIYHTHTTESYALSPKKRIQKSYRSENPENSVVAVGAIVSDILFEEYGIEVLHLTDINDIPYNGAYSRSEDAMKKAMKKYPTIKYSFDIHRDGLSANAENFDVYQTEIKAKSIAKMMLVYGTEAPNTKTNKAFGKKIEEVMDKMYPTMFFRHTDRGYDYNQGYAQTGMLVEMGCNLTTKDEAREGAVRLAHVLGRIFTGE